MAERRPNRPSIDQAAIIYHNLEKGTTEVELASGEHVVGEFIPFDDGDNRAFIVPDARRGRLRKPQLIEISDSVTYLI